MPRAQLSDIVGVEDEPVGRASLADIVGPADDEGMSTSEGLFEIARAGLGMPSERMKEAVVKGLKERASGIVELGRQFLRDPIKADQALATGIREGVGQSVSDLSQPIETLERDPLALAESVAGLGGLGGLGLKAAHGLKVPARLAETGERMMQSAIKPTKAVAKTRTATKRMMRSALEEGIDPSESGLAKAKSTIAQLESQFGPLLKGKTIKPTRPLQPVHVAKEEAKRVARVAPEGPENIQKVIDDFAGEVRGSDGKFIKRQPIPAEEAQRLKVELGQQLRPKWNAPALPESTTAGKKALRYGLRESIEEVAPGVKPINKRLGPLEDLERQLDEYTLRREDNRNILSARKIAGGALGGLSDIASGTMGLQSLAGMLIGGALDNPVVKARVARQLWKLGKGTEKAIAPARRIPIPLATAATTVPIPAAVSREVLPFRLPQAADQGPVPEETVSEFPQDWSEEEEQAFQAWLATQ